jgi:hypothetical protein
MNADVIAAVNAGLTGDLEIRIENGQLFSGMINWAFTSGKMNGYRITIHSDIVTPLSPGGVSGTSSERAVAITDSSAHLDSGGGIVVENLILKSSGNGVVGSPQHINESGFLANANRYLTFQNQKFQMEQESLLL